MSHEDETRLIAVLRAELSRMKADLEEAKVAAARTCYQGGAAAGELLVAKDAEIARLQGALAAAREVNVELGRQRSAAENAAYREAARSAADYLFAHNELVEAGLSPRRPEKARRLADAWIAMNKACARLPTTVRTPTPGLYPSDWPRCRCGDWCMDGKATCGRVECL